MGWRNEERALQDTQPTPTQGGWRVEEAAIRGESATKVQPEIPQFAGTLPQREILPQVGSAGRMATPTSSSLGGRAVAGIVEPAARFLSNQAQELQTDISEMPHYGGPDWSRGGQSLAPAEQTYAKAPFLKQLGYSAAHTGANLVGGPLGFMASLPQMGLDVVNPPEDQTGLGRLAEEGRGFGQMLANFPEQARYVGTFGMDRGVDPEAVQSFHQTGGAEPLFTAGILSGVSGARKAMKPVIPQVRGRYAESGMLPRTRVAELGRMAPEYARTAPEGLGRKAQPRAEWPERIEPKPKEAPDAKRLRKDEGQLRPGRDVPEGRAGKGRPDLERQAPTKPGRKAQKEVAKQPYWEEKATKEGAALAESARDQLRTTINNPNIVGKQRVDAIANQRDLVNFLDTNAGKKLETEFFNGQEIAFTGVVDNKGYREFIYLKGPKAGEYLTRPAKTEIAANLAQKKSEYRKQQGEFSRLAKTAGPKPKVPVSGGIAAQPPVKPPPKKPVVKAVATPEPKGPIALNKAEITRLRKDFGLEKLKKAEREAVEEPFARAKAASMDEKALEVADDVIARRRQVTSEEHAGMVMKAQELADQRTEITKDISNLIDKGDMWAAKKARERADVIQDQFDRLSMASDYAGREQARAFNLRKYGIDRESMEIAPVLQRVREVKGTQVTTKEKVEFERLTSRYSKLEKELVDLRAKHEKMAPEYERLEAEKVTRIENQKAARNKRTTKKREGIFAERDDIKNQLVAMGFQVKDVTGLSAEGSYLVGKLANTYIKEGAITLNGVVRRVIADLPNVNEADVYQSMAARAPKTQAKAMGEAQQRVLRLKKQARLLTQIENAEKGIFEKVGVGRKSQRPEIKKLQKQLTELRKSAWASGIESKKLERAMNTLDELQDQLGSHYKELRKTPLDQSSIESVRAKLKQVRRALIIDKDLASLHKQLDSGDFIIKERPVAKKLPAELERKELELIRARKDIRAAIRDLQPLSTRQKVGEGLNFLRTMKATSDISATLRQSLALSARRPGTAIKVFGRSLKAFGSTYKAEQIDRAIRSHPNQYLREKAGLFLAEFEGPRLTAREEMFMSNWAHKIPGYGRLVKASDRHMVSHINLMRASAFDQFMDAVPNATTREMKAWADFVNVASGRGNLNVGKAGEIASALLFAPRFAWSRVEYPFMLKKHWRNPRVRKEIAKDQVAMAGLFASTLTLASLAGAEVELNPRGSDFGKIKVGNSRYDIGAGFLQPMRYLLRFPARGLDKLSVTGKHLPESEKKFLPMDDFLRLISYKAAPSVTLTDALIRGKFSFGGGEITPANVAYRTLSPILGEAIYDAWRDHESAGKIATIALGEGFGLGVSTYRKKSKVVDVR